MEVYGQRLHDLFDTTFNPKSIAVVGASSDTDKWGGRILALLDKTKFTGRIYPVNPKLKEIFGRECFASIELLPEAVDLVMICVPASAVPNVIDDCIANKSVVAQVISGGFSESGPAGAMLEMEIIDKLSRGPTRLIGPNCMGLYSARGRLSLAQGAHSGQGNISIISQSGGLSTDMLLRGQHIGLRFNKIVSVGNCLDLDSVDFLEYFYHDPETSIIGMYLESTRDGPRLYETLKRATEKKPVILLKGGRTIAGQHSVNSHTGNFAGTYAVWQAVCRQAGVLEIRSFDAFLMALTAAQALVGTKPGGVAFVGNGGGASVLASDACEERGVPMAQFTSATNASLCEILGNIPGNPIDLPTQRLISERGDTISRVISTLFADQNVSAVILQLNIGSGTFQSKSDSLELLIEVASKVCQLNRRDAMMVVAIRAHEGQNLAMHKSVISSLFISAGVPVFWSCEDAIDCLSLKLRLQSLGESHKIRGVETA